MFATMVQVMSMLSPSSRLWSKGLVFAFALAAFFLSLPAGHPRTTSAQSGERTLSVHLPAAEHVRAPRLKSPPVVSAKETARLQAAQTQFHRRGPATRVNPSAATRTAPPSPPASIPRAAATLAKPSIGSGMNAPGTFTLFQNTDLHTVVSNTTSVVAEPSVANIGSAVLETGNWFAAVSTDGGNSFGYLDPFTAFPSVYGGFCCDQSVLYDPSRNLMFWTLMYVPNGTGNIIRLAIAHGEAALETTPIPFYSYGFSPQALGFPAGDWYDYPQMALGSNYLYLTANVFRSDGLTFDGTVVLRMPLDGLASGLDFDVDVFMMSYFNATPVQGATTTMYWATQVDTATLRVYKWPEGGSVSAANVAHTSYPDPSNLANYTCPVNGTDWCGRLDDRVQTGWLSNGRLGFMWSAPKGSGGFGTFYYPYIHTLILNEVSLALVGEPIMHNPAYAYAYPAVGLNARGHPAGPVFYGGGTISPTLAAMIWDDLSPNPYPTLPTAWELYNIAESTQGPTETTCPNCWGDYLAASQDHTSVYSRYRWVATGYTLQGGGSNGNVHPRYVIIGRERDQPERQVNVALTSSLNTSVFGQTVAFTMTVTSSTGVPTGTVTLKDGTGAIATLPLPPSGEAAVTISILSVGYHSVVAVYNGDSNHVSDASTALTQEVRKASTTVMINSHVPNPSWFGHPVSVGFAVTVVAPGTGTPTGTVVVSDGTADCTAQVAQSGCSLIPTLAGAKLLVARYQADSQFNTSESLAVPHMVDGAFYLPLILRGF